MTIRERIQSYQSEILKGNLMPQRAAEILTEMSALLGNINEEITQRDIAYNKILLKELDLEKSANKAKIKAGITEEYEAMRTARNTEKVAIEVIRGLKYYLKSREEEFRQSNN
jgi:hypothetical protein